MSKFDTLLEKEMEQFQTGGYRVGMRVLFKNDALKHEYVQKRAQSFQDIIKACMDPGFDLSLKIGAIKSIYPTTTQNYGNGTESPDGTFLDIYIEYAPGLFRNPMTVPIDIVDCVDEGNNRSPIPNSLKRPNNVHGPKEQKTEQDDVKADVNLTNQNAQMPGANKWDDTKPGGGNFKS
jgi:hypothetical protein